MIGQVLANQVTLLFSHLLPRCSKAAAAELKVRTDLCEGPAWAGSGETPDSSYTAVPHQVGDDRLLAFNFRNAKKYYDKKKPETGRAKAKAEPAVKVAAKPKRRSAKV